MTGRNLTPAEVQEVLDVLENMIAWTARIRQPTEQEQMSFVNIREKARAVWAMSVQTIDGETNS